MNALIKFYVHTCSVVLVINTTTRVQVNIIMSVGCLGRTISREVSILKKDFNSPESGDKQGDTILFLHDSVVYI